jgi:site-specific recombinase XerD
MDKPNESSSHNNGGFSRPDPANYNINGKGRYPCPTTYTHRFPSMERFANSIGLSIKSVRSRHSYYRQVRLVMDYFDRDPAELDEEHLREYFLYVVLEKQWGPPTRRQAVAALKRFYIGMLKLKPWDVFGEVNTKDNYKKPDCPTQSEIIKLLGAFPRKRYRTPTKLIYCCGLRLSECISLTIHDIKREERKIIIHDSKGNRDRIVPVAAKMIDELGEYWSFHKNPLLIFPATGCGSQKPEAVAKRMHRATQPIGRGAFEGAVSNTGKSVNIRYCNLRNLRHSFGTHFCERGGNLLKLQRIMGHEKIGTTMMYLHLTHEIDVSSLDLIENIFEGLEK